MGCCCSSSTATENAHLKSDDNSVPKGGVAPSAKIIVSKVNQAKKTGVLALRECGLKTLPSDAVAADTNTIRTVDLGNNALKALPDTIGAWVGLQNFLCAQNALTELPAAIGQLAGLQKLVLSGNQLRTLPLELSHLGSLRILQLDGNKLGPKLPANVFSGALLGAIEELDLSSNALKEVPNSLGSVHSLVRLVLPRNELRTLPDALGRLTKLQYLDAADNLLSGISPSLFESTCLSELWLKGNPMDRLVLQETRGFSSFLERRKNRIDAKIEANVVGAVDLAVCGLD